MATLIGLILLAGLFGAVGQLHMQWYSTKHYPANYYGSYQPYYSPYFYPHYYPFYPNYYYPYFYPGDKVNPTPRNGQIDLPSS